MASYAGRSSGGGVRNFSLGGYENNGGGNNRSNQPQPSGIGYGNSNRVGGVYGDRTNNLYEQQRLGSRENRQSTFSAAGRANVSSNMWSTSSGSANMQMQQHQATLANNNQRKQSYGHASNSQVQSLDSMVSANAFANGSNQNSGNMMTGRSSTRRIAAPGGNSSLSLGWSGDNGTSNAGRSTLHSNTSSINSNKNYSNSSSLSHNYNQNVGNRIRDNVAGYTTLQRAPNFTIGRPQNYTTSAFGNDSGHNTESNTGRNYNAAGVQSGVNSHRLGGGRPQLEKTEQPRYQPTYESTHALSSNLYANGANQNCGNVMTGRSSTRVSAPPGGYTQWSLG